MPEEPSFAELMRAMGVTPLGSSPRSQPEPAENRPVGTPDCTRIRSSLLAADWAYAETSEAQWCKPGLARSLARLRRTPVPPAATIDLHGLSVCEAWQALDEFLCEVQAVGQKLIEVIHGRGLKKSGGGILKTKVRAWLQRTEVVNGYFEPRSNPGSVIVLMRSSNSS